MIIIDRSMLEKPSRITHVDECIELFIFDKLEKEFKESPVPGLGLSAIQIGYDVRAIYIKLENYLFMAMNAEVIHACDPIVWKGEGCLSQPNKYYDTNRYNHIKIKYTEYPSGIIRERECKGLEAVVWQHEIDHTLGILNYKRQHHYVEKVGRNEVCPCGSGKKFKKCCLK